jgi:hypothetical protein
MFQVSLVNLLATAVAVTASSEASGYPAINIKAPQRPFAPAKTAALGVQSWTIDYGAATPRDHLALIHANFVSARIQLDDAATFDSNAGSPQYDEAVTITRNLVHGRYHHLHRFGSTLTHRHERILVLDQDTIDDATGYRLGGAWAGLLVSSPRGLKLDMSLRPLEPKQFIGPDHEGWEEELNLGNTVAVITATRHAIVAKPVGLSDELRDWLDLERRWSEVGFALVSLVDGDPSQVWVMRRKSAAGWDTRFPKAESQVELKEVV